MECCGRKLIVSNTGSNSISIIDLRQDEEFKEILMNKKQIGSHGLLKISDDKIYSVNSYDNSIFRININKEEIEDVVYVGKYPTHMVCINGTIYVVSSDSNSVTIVDEESFSAIGSIPTGEKPHDIKIDNKRKKIFITNHNGSSLKVIDLNNNIDKDIFLDSNPFHLKILDDLIFILCHSISNNTNSEIKIMNLEDEKIIKSIKVDGTIVDMIKLEGEDIIYVTNADDGCLYKIDFNKEEVLIKYHIGNMLNNIEHIESKLYISDTLNNNILVFDYKLEEVISKIKVGLEPSHLIYI